MAEFEQTVESGHTPAGLWWSLGAGPLAWAIDLGFSYVLTQHSCSTGHHYVLHLITAICFLIAASGAVVGYLQYQRLPREVTEEGPRSWDRAYFQVLFGIVFSVSFAIVVIAGAIPRFILSPCD
jgi:uncharacterized membrane protein YidH (DUF202 family)